MDFLINESQLRLIQQDQSKMTDYMKDMYSFTSKLVEKAKKIYGLNLRLLLTWGASVGGFVLPLDNFIKTGRFNLTEEQQVLILIGIASTYFYDNSRAIKLILKKIKAEGLEDVFKEVLIKSKNLKNSFFKFLDSSNITLGSSMDLIAYSFLIPIINDIFEVAYHGGSIDTMVNLIVKRLVASGVIIVSKIILTDAIKKLVKKFTR